MFSIAALIATYNHSVLRLPPYHPDLNSIEIILALLKNHVASLNTTFKLNDSIELVNEKIALITRRMEKQKRTCLGH